MEINTPFPRRKPNRLKGYDYATNGAYFVTICTANRAPLFGSVVVVVVGATAPVAPTTAPVADITTTAPVTKIALTELGKCVDQTIKIANRGDITIDEYVVMPDHIHMIIVIAGTEGNRGRLPLQNVVRNIKSYVTKYAGFPVWQKSFHDHIIRNADEYIRIANYIKNNPHFASPRRAAGDGGGD